MSINRTRWLDKLRPAGASSGGWTEDPMAPVETTDAATVDQRCPFKHRTGWRHNHSNSKLCVALRMGQANLLSITSFHLCAGAMLSSHSIFHATRFVRVILEQGAMSSSQGKKNDLICACHPCASHTSVSFKKKKLPISDLDCHSCAGAMQQYPESHHLFTRAMQQCPEEETPSSLRRGHATVSSGR